MLLRDALGDLLRRARLARGLTLRQLSDAAAVSVAYLSELERGRKEASSEILAAVCAVLDLSLAEVFHDVGDAIETAELLESSGREAVVLDLRPRIPADVRADLAHERTDAVSAPMPGSTSLASDVSVRSAA
ncbi:helix-turn-helix transcriptional regulator [Agromyces sp. G08B096]|uniref:Helix-turn-helix transcriptional regulator n=1 Tax=Agromyces sp. G08B096 TaxID=3156399 RepID=A0AAU7W2Q0_9MICO